MKKLKFGPHVMLGPSGLQAWLDAVPTVAKFVSYWPSVKVSMNTLTVGRIYNADWDTNYRRGTPREAARAAVADMLPTIHAQPWMMAWELPPNEPVINDRESMLWLAEFYYWGAKEMQERAGRRAVFGHWPVGNPTDLSLWQYYEMALRATREFGAIHARHSYGPVDVWYALRHRLDAAEFAKLGYAKVPTLITECGADRVKPGWGAWREMYGSFDEYWRQWWVPVAGALAEDDYVIGATPFSLGDGGSAAWRPFDVSGTGVETRLEALRLEDGTPPPAPSGTHRVTATVLNVRLHPWLGQVVPPVVGKLNQNDWVTVLDECRGWALIGDQGNQWVSAKWLRALGQ